MKKYVCDACGYVFDPAQGDPEHNINAGTAWESFSADWKCPLCGEGKGQFYDVDASLTSE